MEEVKGTASGAPLTSHQRQLRALEADKLEANLEGLYNGISKAIRQAVGGAPFTADKVTLLVTIVTRAVQDFSDSQPSKITGPEKQALAVNLAKHVLKDFHDAGQLSDEVYNDVVLAITVLGPSLINLVVAGWKKVTDIGQDIAASGCKGCFGRNFGKK